jgi:acyl-CoA thioesterase
LYVVSFRDINVATFHVEVFHIRPIPINHHGVAAREMSDSRDATPTTTGDQLLGPGPFGALLGFRRVRADEDGAHVEADPGPQHLNGGGIVHGGYLSALLDTTTGWAVHAQLGAGIGAPHVHVSVQFVRAALAGPTLICHAQCVSAGRRMASAEAEITQGGRVIARAVTSHAVLAQE